MKSQFVQVTGRNEYFYFVWIVTANVVFSVKKVFLFFFLPDSLVTTWKKSASSVRKSVHKVTNNSRGSPVSIGVIFIPELKKNINCVFLLCGQWPFCFVVIDFNWGSFAYWIEVQVYHPSGLDDWYLISKRFGPTGTYCRLQLNVFLLALMAIILVNTTWKYELKIRHENTSWKYEMSKVEKKNYLWLQPLSWYVHSTGSLDNY